MAQLGRALRSGAEHTAYSLLFIEARKPLKTLGFRVSSFPPKTVQLWFDHLFDHFQKSIEMWLSLVERVVRDDEAAGSNPVISTKISGVFQKAAK